MHILKIDGQKNENYNSFLFLFFFVWANLHENILKNKNQLTIC